MKNRNLASESWLRQAGVRRLLAGAILMCALVAAQPAPAKDLYCVAARQITEACLARQIEEANQTPQTRDVIHLGAGTFRLTKALPWVTSPIAIVGMGAGTTFIHGSCPDSRKSTTSGECSGIPEFPVLTVGATGGLELDGVCIRNGQASDGGGIFNAGSLLVVRSSVVKNHAHLHGGGIVSTGPSLFIQDSTISGNHSHFGVGAGIYTARGVVWILHSTVSGNRAVDGAGGGIFNLDADVSLRDSTISGNVATGTRRPNAGGILNRAEGVMWLKNVTIATNIGPVDNATPATSAGGVYNQGRFHFVNTIMAVNRGGKDGIQRDYACTKDMFSYGGNVVGVAPSNVECEIEKPAWHQDWPSRASDTVVSDYWNIFEGEGNPLLRDNGGTSCTHALRSGGAAIDVAWTGRPDEHVFACAIYDQRWATRPNAATGAGCDSGAFELTGQAPPSGLGCTQFPPGVN